MSRLVTPEMKVDEALKRFPQTLAVFVRYGFKPLQNPLLRATFAPLVTIKGAATMHQWDAERFERFMHELNAEAALRERVSGTPDEPPAPIETLYDLSDIEGMRAQNILVSPELVEVDNRGLEPPEPMVRILAIAQQLAPGQRLEAINQRRPMLLYPKLEELGLTHETTDLGDGSFRITVRREA